MTAAHLEGKYLKETNPERTEDDSFAKYLDVKTLDSWLLHRNIYNVEATDDFEDKINRVIEIINENINKTKYQPAKYEAPIKDVKKYVYDNNLHGIYEGNIYLIDAKEARVFLTKRVKGNNTSYLYRKIIVDEYGEKKLEDKQISEREFISLINIYNPKEIQENYIYRFIYNNQIIEAVNYNNLNCYLNVVNPDPNKEVTFPKEIGDVRTTNSYNMYKHISKYGRKRYLK